MSDFIPTHAGADAVVQAARRRRTAKASAGGSSAVLVVVALVWGLSGGADPVPQRDELVTSTASATPSASGGVRTGPSPTPAAGRSPSTLQGGGALPTPVPAGPQPTQTPPPAQHRTTAPRRSPITRTTGSIAATDLCTDGQADQYRTYCIRVLDPGQVRRGHTVSLGGEFCLYPTSSPMTLDFDSTAEVDLQIGDGSGPPTWYAGTGYRYTRPGPSVTVAPGQCLVWHSPWDTRDAEGFVVPPGSYTLDLMVRTRGAAPIGGDFLTLTVVD